MYKESGGQILAYGITDAGLVRPNNEDALLVWPERRVFAVADGMGGQAAGELASQFFIQTVERVFRDFSPSDLEGVTEAVKRAFLEANREILDHVRENPAREGMGCTAELLAFAGMEFCLGHIGDSRTYLFRAGRLHRLTRDHSLVQEQLEAGILTEEEARRHPMRNVILRALGVKEDLALDLIRGRLQRGDLFLLCSDGLTDMISEELISECLARSFNDLEGIGLSLVEEAKRTGGRDNITVVLVKKE